MRCDAPLAPHPFFLFRLRVQSPSDWNYPNSFLQQPDKGGVACFGLFFSLFFGLLFVIFGIYFFCFVRTLFFFIFWASFRYLWYLSFFVLFGLFFSLFFGLLFVIFDIYLFLFWSQGLSAYYGFCCRFEALAFYGMISRVIALNLWQY
jgi:hypothetical protein